MSSRVGFVHPCTTSTAAAVRSQRPTSSAPLPITTWTWAFSRSSFRTRGTHRNNIKDKSLTHNTATRGLGRKARIAVRACDSHNNNNNAAAAAAAAAAADSSSSHPQIRSQTNHLPLADHTPCHQQDQVTQQQQPTHPQHLSATNAAQAQMASSSHQQPQQVSPVQRVRTMLRLALSLVVFAAAEHIAIALRPPLPPPLAAMLAILSLCIVLRAVRAGPFVDSVIRIVFAPANNFLARWLAVFFAPNLVLLPLAPPLPPSDVASILAVVVLGLAMSSVATLLASRAIKRVVVVLRGGRPLKETPALPFDLNPPSNKLVGYLVTGALLSLTAGVTCIRLARHTLPAVASQSHALSLPAALAPWPVRIYGTLLTMMTFVIGQRLGRRVRLFVHPLLVCILGTIAGVWLLGSLSGLTLTETLRSYYFSRAGGHAWGGGNVLVALLGPAVISFAFQMDKRREVLASRFVEIMGTAFIGSVVGLFGTALLARALCASAAVRLVLIPRQVTVALAIPIAEIMGAHVGLAATIVTATGLLGGSLMKLILAVLRVKDPVSRGLIAGTIAHGIGTASIADEPAAFALAALAMILVGIFSTLLVAVPMVRTLLLRVALGSVAGSAGGAAPSL